MLAQSCRGDKEDDRRMLTINLEDFQFAQGLR